MVSAYTSIKLPAEPAAGAAIPCIDPGMPTDRATGWPTDRQATRN